MSHRRAMKYAAAGAALSFGAPLGWLAIRALGGEQLAGDAVLYGYLAGGTFAAFTAFGATVGALADRLEQSNRQLEELAVTDGLTRLKNPRYFHQRLEEEVSQARRGRPFSLLIADIDHFKRVNDTWGHATGDRVLVAVAAAVSSCTRESDVACRIGGEELALLCPDTDLALALEIAERVRLAVARTCAVGEEPVQVSVGVAQWREDQSAEALFAAADGALYEAKRTGRNRVCAAR